MATGALFITATVTNVVGTALSKPVLDDPHYLARLWSNANLVTAGVLLELIAAGASAAIAISLYPVLRNWSSGLALGSVVFRAIEAVMYVMGAVALLTLLALSRQFTVAAAADRSAFQPVAASLLDIRNQVVVPAVLAFSLGALMYYYLFYQSRLIPRWLSGWGIAAIALTVLACLLALFGHRPITDFTIVVLPIAVQEMVLALWLIVKGFSSTPLQSRTISSPQTTATSTTSRLGDSSVKTRSAGVP